MLVLVKITAAQDDNPHVESPVFQGDALTITAQHYADDFGVTFDEALTRLQLGDEIRELQSYLLKNYPFNFAGLWVQHTPEYRVYIQFTDIDNAQIEQLVEKSPLKNYTELLTAEVSYYQLKAGQQYVQSILQDYNVPFETGINVVRNQVEVDVTPETAVQNILHNGNISFPQYVKIVQVDHLSQPATDIYAGLDISYCTSGFSVLNSNQGEGTLGISTAGHCACTDPPACNNTRSIYYGGTLLPLQGVEYHDSYDIEWHTAPGFTVRNLFFDGIYNVFVYGIRNRADQYVGEYVCKYGKITGSGCGNITSTSHNGTFVRVHSDTINLAEPGDSGGPWFVGNTAYGITSTYFSTSNDATYMAVDYYNSLDLCILRDINSPTVPILIGTLDNGNLVLTWDHGDDVCGHAIHRSQTPYFTPSQPTLVMLLPQSVTSFISGLGVGNVNVNYYYRIRAITGSESTASNSVGEFDFALVPGN